ncbi:chromosome segregation protein Csm1/Pcs1-domain-containing protein [Lineolata rhizophorae]|uniref:Chromosome segregation protein Csm1/Pcs1-domain-containing protein n=1 Tax=Lineolata rhizophorae TaxID=578093 RepID=A0A6A6NTB7_9PEZI|nr:chromosome segregation protein Csm1/Pcs1-domain-containing protein [Lineolata rhizophorae]
MPPRGRGGTATLSHMLDPVSDDDFTREDASMMGLQDSGDSAVENHAPSNKRGATAGKKASTATNSTKKGVAMRTNTSSARVTKATTAGRRVSGGSTGGRARGGKGAKTTAGSGGKAAAATAKSGRTALAERRVNNEASETEEVDEFAEGDDLAIEPEPEPEPKKRGRGRPPVAGKAKTAAAKKRQQQAHHEEDDESIAVEMPRGAAATAKGRGATAARTSKAKSVPTARAKQHAEADDGTAMDIDEHVEQSIETTGDDTVVPFNNHQNKYQRQGSRARSSSRQPQPQPQPYQRVNGMHRRGGSVSDAERTGDIGLRRKLGDMTKKFEALDLKYRNLREASMRDAESSFDRLKHATDERARAQDDIIASLKRELAHQKSLQSAASQQASHIADLEATNARLAADAKGLTDQLRSAHADNKTLSAKLAAARNAAASVESTAGNSTHSRSQTSSAPPSSAIKDRAGAGAGGGANGGTVRTIMVGSAEAAREAEVRALKEELYSDLTGLIVRGVKRGEDGTDTYDCIQTGRNGTLHFHLALANPGPDASYDDAEFEYVPLLDASRDRDLLDVLPDYLTEEICFPRSSAARFYAKVVECMTKRIVVEDE